jgi:hypothetical protein
MITLSFRFPVVDSREGARADSGDRHDGGANGDDSNLSYDLRVTEGISHWP